jgi:hypothetical protein
MSNITNIPAPRVPFIDQNTGLISREWYRFLLNLFTLAGSGTSDVSITDVLVQPVANLPNIDEAVQSLSVGTPQPSLSELDATLQSISLGMPLQVGDESLRESVKGLHLEPFVSDDGVRVDVSNQWAAEQFFNKEFRTPTFGSVAGYGIAPNVTDTYYCGHPSFRWLYLYVKTFVWNGYSIADPAGSTTTFLRNDGTWATPSTSSTAAKFGGLRKTGGTASLGTITTSYTALTTYTGDALANQPGITTAASTGRLQFAAAGDYMLTITFAAGFTADITNARDFIIRLYDVTAGAAVTDATATFYVPANISAMRDTVSVPFNVTAGMVSGSNALHLEVATVSGTIAAFIPQEILYFVASLGPL